ncbi:acylphosphatase-1 [Drosophila navojoa]|uniref:acylphosphatase-1 n=1 Tax=Drosophila navojoa TaxID=7232 RepID=UPI0008470A53|nr:acylphosphatase-1 [Drosophila navojoa]
MENNETQTERSRLQRDYIKRTSDSQKALITSQDSEDLTIKSCEFEIFGIVHDVSFRHYTLRRAQKLSVRGWCLYTQHQTIKGLIQGYTRSFEAMRIWLRYTGSPTSRIDKCVFGPTEELKYFSYDAFTILNIPYK